MKQIFKKKTVRQFLNGLPVGDSGRALNNTHHLKLETRVSSLSEALQIAFMWEDSPEGYEYWARYTDEIKPEL